MKLVLLYGPPAVGKFTISKELAKLTGFKNFHNHLVIDVVNEVFGWEDPAHKKLEYGIRVQVVEEAAVSGINLITTGVVLHRNRFLYQGFIDAYKKNGGEVCVVRLKAGRDILKSRVDHPSRARKINSNQDLEKFFKEFPESMEKFEEGDQLELNTAEISPEAAAQKIVDHFKL